MPDLSFLPHRGDKEKKKDDKFSFLPHRGNGETGTKVSPDLPKISIKGQGSGIPEEMQLLNPTAEESAQITPLLQTLEKIPAGHPARARVLNEIVRMNKVFKERRREAETIGKLRTPGTGERVAAGLTEGLASGISAGNLSLISRYHENLEQMVKDPWLPKEARESAEVMARVNQAQMSKLMDNPAYKIANFTGELAGMAVPFTVLNKATAFIKLGKLLPSIGKNAQAFLKIGEAAVKEAAIGGLYGGVEKLEEGDSRGHAIVENALLFSVFGAALSIKGAGKILDGSKSLDDFYKKITKKVAEHPVGRGKVATKAGDFIHLRENYGTAADPIVMDGQKFTLGNDFWYSAESKNKLKKMFDEHRTMLKSRKGYEELVQQLSKQELDSITLTRGKQPLTKTLTTATSRRSAQEIAKKLKVPRTSVIKPTPKQRLAEQQVKVPKTGKPPKQRKPEIKFPAKGKQEFKKAWEESGMRKGDVDNHMRTISKAIEDKPGVVPQVYVKAETGEIVTQQAFNHSDLIIKSGMEHSDVIDSGWKVGNDFYSYFYGKLPKPKAKDVRIAERGRVEQVPKFTEATKPQDALAYGEKVIGDKAKIDALEREMVKWQKTGQKEMEAAAGDMTKLNDVTKTIHRAQMYREAWEVAIGKMPKETRKSLQLRSTVGAAYGVEKDDEGNVTFNPWKALLGMAAVSAVGGVVKGRIKKGQKAPSPVRGKGTGKSLLKSLTPSEEKVLIKNAEVKLKKMEVEVQHSPLRGQKTKVYDVHIDPAIQSELGDLTAKTLTPEAAYKMNSSPARQAAWKDVYARATAMGKVAKFPNTKVGGNAYALTEGCQRSATTVERVANKMLPKETRMEACYGGSCFKNKAVDSKFSAFENIDVRDLKLSSPAEIKKFFKWPKRAVQLNDQEFLRMGVRGDDSHAIATGLAETWLKEAKAVGVKRPTVFITASYAPVSPEMYKRLLPYKDQFVIHFSNSGWFHKNEIAIRFGEFLEARKAGLNVKMRMITNESKISGMEFRNQKYLDSLVKKYKLKDKEILETPFHDDALPHATRTSKKTGKYKNVCCLAGDCRKCGAKCMTKECGVVGEVLSDEVDILATATKELGSGEFTTGLIKSIGKDIKNIETGIVASPHKHMEEFLQKNKLLLSNNEKDVIKGFMESLAKRKLMTGEQAVKEIDQFIAKEFGEKFQVVRDVRKQAIKEAKPVTPDARKWYVRWMEGELLGDVKTKSILRKAMGKRKQSEAEAVSASTKRMEYFDKQADDYNIQFMKQIESGNIADPVLREVAKDYRQRLDKAWADSFVESGGKQAYIENYFPHLWKDPGKARKFSNSAYGGLYKNPFFQKKRYHDLIEDGLNAGLELKSTNPELLVLERELAGFRYRETKDILNELKSSGYIKFVPSGQRPPEGWAKVNGNALKVFVPTEKGMVQAGEFYAIEKGATVLNNFLSKGFWSLGETPFKEARNKGLRGLAVAKNNLVALKLGLSGFHFIETTTSSHATTLGSAVQAALRGDIRRAVSQFGKWIPVFGDAVVQKRGRDIYSAWKTGKFRNEYEKWAVEQIEMAGGALDMPIQYKKGVAGQWKNMIRNFRHNKYGLGAVQIVPAIMEQTMKPLMEIWIPRLKAFNYITMVEDFAKRNPQIRQNSEEWVKNIQKLWDSVDNRFGQLQYDNLFWNRMARDIGVLSQISMGWNIGTFREFGGGVIDMSKAVAGAALKKKPEIIVDRMLYTAMYTAHFAAMGGMMTKMLTGEYPKQFLDFFYPRTGTINQDGTAERVQMPTMLKEVASSREALRKYGATGLGVYASHKLAPIFSLMWDMVDNKNFYGVDIRDPQAPIFEQVQQLSAHLFEQGFLPISVSSYMKHRRATDKQDLVNSMLPFWGFSIAPGYVTKTPMQKEIFDLFSKRIPNNRTRQEWDAYQKRAEVKRMIGLGQSKEALKEFQKLQREGVIPRKTKWTTYKRTYMLPSDIRAFKNLPKYDQDYLWNKMNAVDKLKYGKYYHKKKK
jgi:hypothetical protein